MTPAVCRSARALLALTQRELAGKANISAQTVADYERGARRPHANNLVAIQHVYEAHGIRFVEMDGVIVGIHFAALATPTGDAIDVSQVADRAE